MKITVPTIGIYTLSLYDAVGRKVNSQKIQIQNVGQNYINLDLSQVSITMGKYTLQIEGNSNIAYCSIIIQ